DPPTIKAAEYRKRRRESQFVSDTVGFLLRVIGRYGPPRAASMNEPQQPRDRTASRTRVVHGPINLLIVTSNHGRTAAMVGVSEGLDLGNLNEISPEEVNNHLMRVWSWRGPLYELYANSLMLDYAPDFAKLHRWGSDLFGRPSRPNIITLSMQNIHSYMMFGWETGILNEFITLRRNGMPVEQVMELVMFSQLYAGMRGLGHVYRAVGDMLPVFGAPPTTVEFPDGWAADPEAFKAGLDFSTREMTAEDLRNLTRWYES